MTSSADKIDQEKLRLEASVIPKLKNVFTHMAQDAETLYRRNGVIPEELAENYYPEFLKEIRDAMRRTIKTFGFELRSTLEQKHGLFFDAEFKRKFIGLEVKEKMKIVDEDLDPKLEEINNQFMIAATLFVANQSEAQTKFITATNAKELTLAAQQEEILFAEQAAQLRNEISRMADEANNLLVEQARLRERMTRANQQLIELQRNSKTIIAKNIKQNLIDRSQARSELIASQNVGMTEAWTRQKEAELIEDAGLVGANKNPINITKTWTALLDSKTRESHVEADGQTVGVNDFYNIGGFQALYPRDPNLPASESINCRCVSQNSVN